VVIDRIITYYYAPRADRYYRGRRAKSARVRRSLIAFIAHVEREQRRGARATCKGRT
jgi:hypothetical protein